MKTPTLSWRERGHVGLPLGLGEEGVCVGGQQWSATQLICTNNCKKGNRKDCCFIKQEENTPRRPLRDGECVLKAP